MKLKLFVLVIILLSALGSPIVEAATPRTLNAGDTVYESETVVVMNSPVNGNATVHVNFIQEGSSMAFKNILGTQNGSYVTFTLPNLPISVGTKFYIFIEHNGNSFQSQNYTWGGVSNVPEAPIGLAHSNVIPTGWTESWEPVAGASSYNVYLNGSKAGSVTDAVYDFTGKQPGTTYTVTVSSVNASGQESDQSATDTVQTRVAPSGDGGSSFSPIRGQLIMNFPTGTPVSITQLLGEDVSLKATVLSADGQETIFSDFTIGNDGEFQLGSHIAFGTYLVILNVIAPDGKTLAGEEGTLTVSADRRATLQADLIDPYGIIQDSLTKQAISGVKVSLYWADTELNRSKGKAPGTLVKVPELPDFAPNQNHNPQVSTAEGKYGWMVFPDGDYYVIGEKEGYVTYDSRQDRRDEKQGDTSYIHNGIVHVGNTIVQMNFTMDQVHKSYISGYPDGTFRPDQSMTRAELASILSRFATSGGEKSGNLVFTDVPDIHWASAAIGTLNGKQWMAGYPDGSFKPDSPVTRAEITSALVKLKKLEVPPTSTDYFPDVTSHWAKDMIGSAKEQGWLSGYPDGTFRPDQPVTRAEAVVLINRMLDRKPQSTGNPPKWSDVGSTHWAYGDIWEAAVSR